MHPSAGARGKGGKGGAGGSDAAFHALMGGHVMPMPMAAGMQAGMMAPGMAHLATAAGPPRELMHQLQMQQVGFCMRSAFQTHPGTAPSCHQLRLSSRECCVMEQCASVELDDAF